MKKKHIIVISILLIIALIGGYKALDNIFPKASPINCPDAKSIAVITLTGSNDSSLISEATDITEILNYITVAEPTRRASVNDYPAVKDYYIIEFNAESDFFRYFLYTENSQVYIESPYEGIYKANRQLIDSVSKYF